MNGTAAIQNSTEDIILNSRAEFEKRRWILITNIPDGIDLEDLKENFLHGFDAVDLRIEKNSAFILLGSPNQSISAINSLNGQSFHGYVVGVSLAPPDSLLFVGNLPFEFTEEQFRNLMSPFGPIERLLLVRSIFTGESKGYGFVDYINRESATQAKQQLMSKGSKYVGGRILRVDFAEPNLLTYEDLHSKTLFVDRLPRDFTNAEMLRDLFSQSGTVTFAQVAVNNQTGISRGFAFVDYVTAEEAERGQKAHNGALLEDSHIRVAYGTPGRTGASILGSHHNTSAGGQQHGLFGPRPRGPSPHVPQGVDVMGARGPRPLMAPRPLMGSEPWQQMPRGHLGKPPRPLMRPGPPGPRPMMGRFRGPSPVGPRAALLGHGPRPLLGRPPGPRPLIRHPTGPRGFVGMGVGGPSGGRPMAPRGPIQPRPLMDFGEQLDGTAFPLDQMQAGPVGAEVPSQQYTGDAIPTLMGDPVSVGSFPPAADPGVFGQPVQAMTQPQEVFVPPAQQQGMLVPSQPQPGPRAVVPQMQQVQVQPGGPVAAYTGTLPAAAQTQVAVMPQAQPSVLVPPQQQVPNNQVLYAAPSAMPVQNMVPQVVAQDPAQYQSGVVPGNHGMTPATPVTGQAEMSAAQYGATPGMQPVAQVDPAAAVSSGYVVLSADATQQSGFYTPQDAQPYPLPQYTTAGQQTAGQQQPAVGQLPVGVQPGTVLQTQVPSSQPSAVPMVTPQGQQYQWYQQVAPAVVSAPVSTPQITQNTPIQGGSQWSQGELVVSSQPIATAQSSGMYGQYQQTPQYLQQQQQQAATPGAETVVYYQQPQLQQQQLQQQQPSLQYPGLMEPAPSAAQQAYPSVAAVPSSEHAIYPNASVAPQHSAPPVVYNSPQPSQLVATGGPPQLSQKRAADGDTGQYGQQGPPSYYDPNKRLRY